MDSISVAALRSPALGDEERVGIQLLHQSEQAGPRDAEQQVDGGSAGDRLESDNLVAQDASENHAANEHEKDEAHTQ
jgi:hypothetical protein